MWLATLALLLGISYAVDMDYDYTYCDDMQKPLCIEFAREMYNYTVPEIRQMTTVMRMIMERRIACKIAGKCPTVLPAIQTRTPCSGGTAAGYACDNVDLLAFVPLYGASNQLSLGANSNEDGNDIWGWTDENDPLGSVRRYAITGQTASASIVDITNPQDPQVLCRIPSRVSTQTVWRDMKIAYTSSNVAYLGIVADRSGQGLQYVNLRTVITKCRSNRVPPRPYDLQEGVDFGWIGGGVFTGGTNTHNIVGLDKSTTEVSSGDSLYIVGSNSCSGGPLKVSFEDIPPQFAGCYSSDGYSHDAECWIYSGPDNRYTGSEICVGYNENSITIIDYTNQNSPQMISRLTYSTSRYTHQGWRTEDQKYLLMNDELDESRGSVPSQTTYVVDIQDLQNPVLRPWYSGITSIDHNLYIKKYDNGKEFAIESNYRAGLRINEIDESQFETNTQGVLTQTGFFKTWAGSMANSFNGMWSSYPYYDDDDCPGLIVSQDIELGLFIFDACNALGLSNCGTCSGLPAKNATRI